MQTDRKSDLRRHCLFIQTSAGLLLTPQQYKSEEVDGLRQSRSRREDESSAIGPSGERGPLG
jgi:hypothetical protein